MSYMILIVMHDRNHINWPGNPILFFEEQVLEPVYNLVIHHLTDLEILFHFIEEQVLEPVSILVVHQSVLKDSTIFMIPQAKERWFILENGQKNHKYATKSPLQMVLWPKAITANRRLTFKVG